MHIGSATNHNIFLEASQKKIPLLLDGSMGSYLQQKGFETDDNIWTSNLNFTSPDEIIKIHREYILSGADIITSNTFRTNPSALERKGIADVATYVKQAANLARQAADNKKVLVAGSNAPAEDCYQVNRTIDEQKLELNHCKHIDLLIDNDVDFILNETQSHFDEIRIICEHCERFNIPYVLSLYFNESLNLLSGESVEFILSYLKNYHPIAIGFNCVKPELLIKLIRSTQLPSVWGFYLNCGSGNPSDKIIECGISPIEYVEIVSNLVENNPSLIGSCCGSSPTHTRKIREFLDGKYSS